MNKLTNILADAVEGAGVVTLGDETANTAAMQSLDARLVVLRKELELYFALCAAMIVVLFVVQIGIVIVYIDQPNLVRAAVAAFGVSAAGLVLWMARLWRERDRVSTIIAIAQSLGPAELRAVLYVMLDSQFGKKTRPAGTPLGDAAH
jgi:hypothetical protein